MLIKLNFTTAKTPAQIWRVVADIIQTTAVNSVAALRVRSTAASYNSDLLQGFVDATSYIVRSNDITGNTTCHIARPNVASGAFAFEFILKQKVYDASTSYVVRLDSTLTTGVTFQSTVGTSTGDLNANQWDLTASSTQTVAQGSVLGIGGTLSNVFYAGHQTSQVGIFCIWVYLTDTCFIWAANRDQYTISGFPSSNWDPKSSWNGPHIYSQYTRGDYWNTDANGIIPLVFTQHAPITSTQHYTLGKSHGEGFLSRDTELAWTQNVGTSQPGNIPFHFLNGADNNLSTSTAPRNISTNILGSLGIATKWADYYPLGRLITQSSTAPSLGGRYDALVVAYTSLTGQTLAAVDRSNFRYVSDDLQSYYGYILYPMSARNSQFNMNGGNITDKSGVYLFNGDFFPGDEVTVGGVTYVLLAVGMNTLQTSNSLTPVYTVGTQSRVALAVPKS